MLSLYGLSISLILWILLLLLIYGHRLHSASEQIRLDAYALSLCHQRAHLLQEALGETNSQIASIQNLMDEIAAAAMASSVFGPEAWVAAQQELQVLSASAAPLLLSQEEEKSEYKMKLTNREGDLAKKNDLLQNKGELSPQNISSDLGDLRETHGPLRLTYEKAFSILWPKRLTKGASFAATNSLAFHFSGKRIVPSMKSEKSPQALFKMQDKKFAAGVGSGCHLESDLFFQNVEVIRDR